MTNIRSYQGLASL